MNNQWSWKLGNWAGIGVYLHWTFFLVPLLVFFSSLNHGLISAVNSVAFVLALFACVVLHEYGHALMARYFGVGTRDITLYPIGGVARLDRIPERPYQELLVAIAGPAVNVVIAFVLLAGFVVGAQFGLVQPISALTSGQSFLANLMLVNVALVVFNMLPAFPMDGGRVLRSILAMNMPYMRATDIAVTVGRVCAIGLGVLALVNGAFNLMLIALFVYFAGSAEASQARMRYTRDPSYTFKPSRPAPQTYANSVPVQFQSLRAESRAANVIDALMSSPQQSFPVMAGQRYIGMLFKSDVLSAIARGFGNITVGELVRV